LVKNVRINGTPTKQHITYLGGISGSRLKSAAHRVRFWKKVGEELDALGAKLSPSERAKIEAALAARVRRPSKAEMRRHQRTQRAEDEPLLTKAANDWIQDSELDLEEEHERPFVGR